MRLYSRRTGPNRPSSSSRAGPSPAAWIKRADQLVFGPAKQRVQIQPMVQQVKGPLKHGRGRADRVVPVDFAEHHVPREDHHFGRRAAFVGDRQPVAGLVQAQAANQTLLVEIAAVGNSGVQAVPHQVIHLVGVDRPRQQAVQDLRDGFAWLAGQQGDHLAGLNAPTRFAGRRPSRPPTESCWRIIRVPGRRAIPCLRSRGRTASAPDRAAGPRRSSTRRREPAPPPRNADREPAVSGTAAPSDTRPANARTAYGARPDRPGRPGPIA